MSKVNELERITQNRIIHEIFENKLGYKYLGNFKDRKNNSNIEEKYFITNYVIKYKK